MADLYLPADILDLRAVVLGLDPWHREWVHGGLYEDGYDWPIASLWWQDGDDANDTPVVPLSAPAGSRSTFS